MALLQIAEPGMSGVPHQHNYALGIDLGTTNSLVACVLSGETKVFADINGSRLLPSVVYYNEDSILVGKSAYDKYLISPENTIVSVKRMLGKSLKSVLSDSLLPYDFATSSDMPQIKTAQGYKTPTEISAEILKRLSSIASLYLEENPIGVVITVPAYFDEGQRQATKNAAQLANLNVLRLLSEPTAAAIAYGLENKKQGKFIVYDLGGGTFDVSILELHNGVFEVLSVNGDTKLGGDDFDHRLYCYILEVSGISVLNNTDHAKVLAQAKLIKEQLSTLDKVSFNLLLSTKQLINLTITREDFVRISQKLVDNTINLLKKALRDAKLSLDDIDDVILVGGSTRMPIIKNALVKLIGKPALDDFNPDEVVAIGAAMQANLLAGNVKDDWLLLDVTPLSLGVETMGGLVEKIIPRNSAIPTKMAQDFTTYKDGQTAMSVHIVQGEREKVSDCISLAKFTLRGIPPLVAGAAKIRVTYQIDADGLLSVSAQELTSGVISSLEVKPSNNLSVEQIASILTDSISSSRDDMNYRKQKELEIDIRSLIAGIERNIAQYPQLLSIAENEVFVEKIKELSELIAQDEYSEDNYIKTKRCYDDLNQLTSGFASKIMNESIKHSLQGKQITKITDDFGL